MHHFTQFPYQNSRQMQEEPAIGKAGDPYYPLRMREQPSFRAGPKL